MNAPAGLPTVALAIPNRDGAHHVPACLDSVAALDYPENLLEAIVVDNGSTDGSVELLRERYPWARVLAQSRNVGFAAAVNVAARSSSAECLALANNDMRLDEGWLRELVRAYEPGDGVTCIGGVILDWDGDRAQFVGGIVNFHGAAAQVGFDLPLAEVDVEDGRELPFACGGSMLIGRERFLELGGFDERFFAYFEDVDLGWRLRLAGDTIRLAAAARCFHRHHATGARIPLAERLRRYEANWLRTVLKNAGDEHVWRLLGAALLLVSERARWSEGDESRARTEAVADVVGDLRAILEQRRAVQSLRRRSDDEVFATFGRPFFPALDDVDYARTSVGVIRALGLEDVFPGDRPGPDEEVELLLAAHGRLRAERSRTRRVAGALLRRSR